MKKHVSSGWDVLGDRDEYKSMRRRVKRRRNGRRRRLSSLSDLYEAGPLVLSCRPPPDWHSAGSSSRPSRPPNTTQTSRHSQQHQGMWGERERDIYCFSQAEYKVVCWQRKLLNAFSEVVCIKEAFLLPSHQLKIWVTVYFILSPWDLFWFHVHDGSVTQTGILFIYFTIVYKHFFIEFNFLELWKWQKFSKFSEQKVSSTACGFSNWHVKMS